MLEVIKTRRSIRAFTNEGIDAQAVEQILEAGTWAPSGLNNQPWRFVVVKDREIKEKISHQTTYASTIQDAPLCIAVFLDRSQSYDRVKDIQAVGACIQNMLLAIHSLNLGAVWLGEILKNREAVEEILKVPADCELMAVVACGRPAEKRGEGSRKPVSEVVIGRY